jgi:hypothetical protein
MVVVGTTAASGRASVRLNARVVSIQSGVVERAVFVDVAADSSFSAVKELTRLILRRHRRDDPPVDSPWTSLWEHGAKAAYALDEGAAASRLLLAVGTAPD